MSATDNKEYITVCHNISPICDNNSEILILGSFPSVQSRKEEFFYANRQNRFWRVASGVYKENTPVHKQDKIDFLIRNKIALWDVVRSCEIIGSQDSRIRDVIPNDIQSIIGASNIKRIFANGRTAFDLYNKYVAGQTRINAMYLPSTSPANASFSFERLLEEWEIIKETE